MEGEPAVLAIKPKVEWLAERFGISEDRVADILADGMRRLSANDHTVAPGPLLELIVDMAERTPIRRPQQLINLMDFYVTARNERGKNHEAAKQWLLGLMDEAQRDQ